MKDQKGFWYLLSGLLFGLALGVLIAWVIAPVQYFDTTPATLRSDLKDEYRFMISAAFAANNDLLRAQARLDTLEDPDRLRALREQAQRMLAAAIPMEKIQTLADLTTALQSMPAPTINPTPGPDATKTAPPTGTASPTSPFTSTPTVTKTSLPGVSPTSSATGTARALATSTLAPTKTASPTAEATATLTPKPIATLPARPTQPPSPTPGLPFKLTKQSSFCEPTYPGLLRVNLTDSAGKPAAGIELVITWADGEEHFFTGFKPELGFGYADFKMTEQVEYTLSLSSSGTRFTGLKTPRCKDDQGKAYPGGIQMEFKQP